MQDNIIRLKIGDGQKINTDMGRFYELDGHHYPSVTTILDTISDPNLINWYKSCPESIINRKCTQAADFGTQFHKIIEDFLNSEDVCVDGTEFAKPFEKFLQFFEDHDLETIATEIPVFSKTHGYTGS